MGEVPDNLAFPEQADIQPTGNSLIDKIAKFSIAAIILIFLSIMSCTLALETASGEFASILIMVFGGTCIALQPLALIYARHLWKKDRAISLGLFFGLFLLDIALPLFLFLWPIYSCAHGICPPGLTGG